MGARKHITSLLRHAWRLLQNRRYQVLILGTLVVIICAALFALSSKPERTASKGRTNLETVKTVPFKTILPKNTSIEKLGGWRRVSPSDSDLVVGYSDTLASVGIAVTEQRIPRTLKGNSPEKLADLAHKFNATDKLNVKNATVYIGTSAKGPQSVICIKNDLLILIKSKDKISDSDWIRYISSLE